MITTPLEESRPRLWNAQTGEFIAEVEIGDSNDGQLGLWTVAFSESGKVAAFPCSDGTLRLWDLETRTTRIARGHTGTLQTVSLSPDDSRAVTYGSDGTLNLWDISTPEPEVIRAMHNGGGHRLGYSAQAGRAVISDSNTIQVWDVRRGELLAEYGVSGPVDISADGQIVVTGSEEGTIRIHRVTEGRSQPPANLPHALALAAPAGPDMFATVAASGGIDLVDSATGRILSSVEAPEEVLDEETEEESSEESNEEEAEEEATNGKASFVWLQANEHGYAALSRRDWLFHGTITDGQLSPPIQVSDKKIARACLSGDAKRLAAAAEDGGLILWETEAGTQLAAWNEKKVEADAPKDAQEKKADEPDDDQDSKFDSTALAISANGRLLASAENDVVQIWRLEDQSLLGEYKDHSGGIDTLAFQDDGRRLLVADGDGSAKIVSVQRLTVQHRLSGHKAPVTRFVGDESERRLMTISIDGAAIVWDTATGRQIRRLHTDREVIVDGRFLYDATLAATVSASGAIRVWSIRTGEVIMKRRLG